MGLKTVNWDRVVALAGAKIGSDLNDKDGVRLGALINSAAQYIFDESRYHPRFLVLEPRTANSGYIEPIEDSFNVYGAGTSFANGLYVRSGTLNGKVRYALVSADVEAIELTWSGSRWEIVVLEYITSSGEIVTSGGAWVFQAGDILYISTDTGTTPPEDTWVVEVGGTAAPRVQAISEIDEIISYWNGAKWSGSDPSQEYGYPDQNGFRLTTDFTGTIYVAFKKALPTEYGDGNQGTTEDFPAEWLNYCAYSAAREWSGSNRNQDSYNPVSVRDVDKREAQVLIKANRQGAFDTIANIWRTRFSAFKT